jgi:hypothetical protein
VEVTGSQRRFPVFTPVGRSILVLFAAGFIAFQFGKNEVTPATLLAVSAVVALVVAIQLVPHGPVFIRKPKHDPDEIALQTIQLEPVAGKWAYSPPHLMQFESREVSEPVWGPWGEEASFRLLRPFYVVYPKRDITTIAVSLEFQGDKEYSLWQPVANSLPEESHSGDIDKDFQWVLIGYVPPSVSFDAKLQLRDTESRLGLVVLRDPVAAEDRPFESIHLKIFAR